jgi:hypothetical protein
MKSFSLPSAVVALTALLGALVFFGWYSRGRVERVEYLSNLTAEAAVPDPGTATGWRGNRRWLIAPEHNNNSYQWIIETQQMLAGDTWRLREVVFDNGNEPRAVGTPSPYRWWLAAMSRLQQAVAGGSPALAVERAALFADPLLFALGLAGGAILLWLAFGPWPSAVWALTAACLYPFASSYVPGAPDSPALSLLLAIACVLAPAAAFLHADGRSSLRQRSWMIAAGVAGALGLWTDGHVQLPILAGFAVVALGVMLLPAKEGSPSVARLWRSWAWSGGLAATAAWLCEYCPDRLDWDFHGNHPVVGLGWIAVGEMLALASDWRAGHKSGPGWSIWIRFVLAVLSLIALGWLLWKSGQPWLQGRDVFGTRLTSLPHAASAENSLAWIRQAGSSPQLLATLLPFGLLIVPLWMAGKPRVAPATRLALLPAIGAWLVAVGFAWSQLRWWAAASGLLLAVLVPVTILLSRRERPAGLRLWLGALLLCLLPGVVVQKPEGPAQYKQALTQLEVESLVERSLAHWLVDQAGETPVLLAPPFRTTSLAFHGNVRVLGSLNLANKDALVAAARTSAATSSDEAEALMQKRGVTHVVIPSWDGYLDEYAREFTSRPENSFITALKNWAMPPWLRPVAYQIPVINGFENQSVVIFERTDAQDTATTLARLAEYFLEMDHGDLVTLATSGLGEHPENLAALAALAQVEIARGDTTRFQATLKTLLSVYGATDEHDLSWDRRVSLAVVLMQGKQQELARRELELCLSLVDEARLRSLSVGSLYRFQVLLRALNLQISDARLQKLATSLLPDGLRARLQ